MNHTYRVVCWSEAVSPIAHMAGSAGNEALVLREPVLLPGGVAWLPFLSGNALRHRCIRAPGWRYLVDRYQLKGKMTWPQLNFAFHGGNLTEGGGRENTARIVAMQRLFPLARLVGGCLPDQVLASSLDVWRGRLVCEENRAVLTADLPAGWELPKALLRPAEAYVGSYQYTRGDAAKSAADLLPPPGGAAARPRGANEDGSSNLMVFAGQAVSQGACFVHGFLLKHVSALELGALLWSLTLWQAQGGTIGGQAARGHGRLRTAMYLADEPANAVADYLAHVDAVRAEAVAWLTEAFAPRKAATTPASRSTAEATTAPADNKPKAGAKSKARAKAGRG